MKHGFLLIDKAIGPTSHDVVSTVRRVLKEPKVGHLGTLDPSASGLLVLGVGAKALKIIELFSGLGKEYVADVHFGEVSTTYDGDGFMEQVILKPGVSPPDLMAIQNIITARFMGKISQVPPAHSAVKVNGMRAYELARKGKDVALKARDVDIAACDVLEFAYPKLKLRIACSSGTYIRSLAHDMGQLLRVGAYLEGLRRTRVGNWSVDDAVSAEKADWGDVLPLKDVLRPYPSIDLTAEEARYVRNGRTIGRRIDRQTFGWFDQLPIALLVPSQNDPAMCGPRKVL